MRFHDKVVIVTGGSKGIGAGCARVFCQEGGLVAIADIDTDAGQQLADEISSAGPGRAICIPCDVRDYGQIEAAIEQTVQHFGRLDCLINNAGWHPPALTVEEMSLEEMEDLFRLNFFSTYAASRCALPHLRKTRGTIVNISSMTAVLGQDQAAAYAATKGAQLSFTKALAIETGPAGVRVNAVLPSNVDTPLMRAWANSLPDPEAAVQRMADLQVFRRLAQPEEIGRVCLFLASDDSSFVTGQGIEVEGGSSLDY
jgi:L-fucose dehydrogenase